MNYWKLIFWILGLIPLGFITSILSFYFHAGHVLGRMPSYNQPDPKELDLYSYYSHYIDWSGLVWIYSFPLWFILLITYLILKKNDSALLSILFGGFLHILGIAICFSDILTWYLD